MGTASLIVPESLFGALPGRSDADRPNFVIMIADDQGWNDVGCYGHSHIRTPNIDRLASEGLRFTHAFLTCSSCSPTRCSIMTGRYPHSTGAKELHQPLPADQVVFAELLKQGGYYTASAGKWHLGEAAKANFDTVAGGGPSGCERWIETLQKRPKDQPFFMWLAAIDPHRRYQPNTIAEPHGPEDVVVPPFLPDIPETRRDLAMYYDEITRMDGYIGRVLDELDRQGVADNTFVLFLSDNGRPFPRCKTTVYDSGIKTPFIARWPGHVPSGRVCDSLVSVIDIAPTIIELASLASSPTFQGESFVPLLRDSQTSTRQSVFAEHNWHDYRAHERAARSKRYLYIRNALPEVACTPPADAVRSITFQAMRKLRDAGKLSPAQQGCFVAPRTAEELYDVELDPYQLMNVAADPKYARVLAQMRSVHEAWARRTHDEIPSELTPDRFDRETGARL
ncbi:MAG: sulfatase [Phycisphaerales bacterium]|nr:MAG: sulfatase [Phycisphaerales bacterium]